MADTVAVVIAHHWADHRECCPDGKPQEGCAEATHRVPYDELSLDEDFARQLVDAGIANFATAADAIAAGGDVKRVAPPVEERQVTRGRAPSRDDLVAQAEAVGIEVPDKATKKEIAELLAQHHEALAQQGNPKGE